MPSAPTLNRPPRLPQEQKTNNFGGPQPSVQRGPTPSTSDNNQSLMQAAVAQSTKGNTLQSGAGVSDPLAPAGTPPNPQYGNIPSSKTAPGVEDAKVPSPPPGTFMPGTYQPTSTPGSQANDKQVAGPNAKPPGQWTPAATVQAPGAPPGVPDTGYNIPLLPQDEASIQGAQQDFSDQTAAANLGIGQAAFAYGDPTQMQRFGVGSINPNSALAMAALRAQEQQQASTNARGRAGTLFSGLALQDRSRIGAAQQRADLLGNTRYQAALARFNAALTTARTTRDKTINSARADERSAAIANLPTANTASGGFPSTTSTGSKSISKGPKASSTKTQKGSTVTVPKTGKAGKPSSTSAGTVHKPSSSTVKKPPKAAGRRA